MSITFPCVCKVYNRQKELDSHLMRFTGCDIGPDLARAMEREIRRFMIIKGLWQFNDYAVMSEECKFLRVERREIA